MSIIGRSILGSFLALTLVIAAAPAAAQDDVQEYHCPAVVEYMFKPHIKDNFLMVAGGNPLVRLDRAEVDWGTGELVCHYEPGFASVKAMDIEEERFGFVPFDGQNCPEYAHLMPVPGYNHDWDQPTGVKVDKSHGGNALVVPGLTWAGKRFVQLFQGCAYDKEIVEDPDDYAFTRPFDGVCEINDTADGFRCADSWAQLGDDDDPQDAPPPPFL